MRIISKNMQNCERTLLAAQVHVRLVRFDSLLMDTVTYG
jgi:hypothetical protein